MKRKHLRFGIGFRVVLSNKDGQAAEMTLAPGETEGGPDNNHRGASQWLFVQKGMGLAIVDKKRCPLRPGTLLLIEKGENHKITNTGLGLLKTLNIYVPPAYRPDGTALPRGNSKN
ncbi:MAG: cupin domain-containing protein [Gemmatales bacterium]